MAKTPFPPPSPSGRVETRSAADQALLEERLARLAARRAASGGRADTPTAGGTPARTAPGRRHPAARARMAAVALSVASTAGLVALFASSKPAGAGSEAESASARIVRSGAATSPAATVAAPSSAATAAPTAPMAPQTTEASAGGADATTVVDGAAYNNRWGNVQVEATFDANGALVDVVALQTPNDRDKSIRINDRAVPELTAEALDAQSASIDSISGATYTSHDYSRSLQSAIDAARAAGVTAIA